MGMPTESWMGYVYRVQLTGVEQLVRGINVRVVKLRSSIDVSPVLYSLIGGQVLTTA